MMERVQEENSEFPQFKGMAGVSNELCLAGVGAHHLYYFLRREFPELVNSVFDQEFDRRPEDRLKLIMENGFLRNDEICEKAVELWLQGLGSEIGNFIAKTIPYGGFYIMGGLVTRNAESISQSSIFRSALYSKPPHVCEIINNVPIYIVKHSDVGMLGVIRYAKNLLNIK